MMIYMIIISATMQRCSVVWIVVTTMLCKTMRGEGMPKGTMHMRGESTSWTVEVDIVTLGHRGYEDVLTSRS